MGRLGQLAWVVMAAAAATLPATAQLRRDDVTMATAGGYLLANEDGTRRCLVLLRAVQIEGGLALGYPAHCRIGLSILNVAVAWSVERTAAPLHGLIRLHDATGKVLITFDRNDADEGVSGRDAGGTRYALTPGDKRSLGVRYEGPSAARPRGPPPQAGPSTTPLAADAGPIRAAAGEYRMLRPKDRATGCVLTLAPAESGPAKAGLAPGCSDKGVTFFAPQGWSISGGTLWLLNARGQRLSFDRTRQGHWEKSAGQGEPLSLIRN